MGKERTFSGVGTGFKNGILMHRNGIEHEMAFDFLCLGFHPGCCGRPGFIFISRTYFGQA